MARDPATTSTAFRHRLGRGLGRGLPLAWRMTRWVLLGVVSLALLLVLLLALPTGRQFLLRAGFDLADRNLPGDLRVQAFIWPHAGELSLTDMIWIDGPDTLARVETLTLSIDLADLWHRDLTVNLAMAKGVIIDLPAIRERLPAVTVAGIAPPAPDAPGRPAETDPAAPGPATRFSLPLLRMGAIKQLPSIAVRQLTLARAAIKTAHGHIAHLDSLNLVLELRHGHRPQCSAGLRARPLSTLGLSWRLRGTASEDTLDLAMAPLHLAAPARLPALQDLPLDGRLRLPLALIDSLVAGNLVWPTLAIDRLQIEGDAGTWRLDAHLDGRSPGQVVLRSVLPEAPIALLAGLAALADETTITAAKLDTLAARWSDDGPPEADLTLHIVPPIPMAPLTQARLRASGRFRLPAPAAIAPILPPQLVIADLGPIELDLDARYDGTVEPARIGVNLDLDRTAWIEHGNVSVTGDRAALHHADLAVRMPGVNLLVAGHGDLKTGELALSLDLPDASLLRRWRGTILEERDLKANLNLQASGPWTQPRADLHATIAAPPATVTLRGRLDVFDPATSPIVTFSGEHLALSLDRLALTSTEPWQLTYSACDRAVCVSSLRLAGSMGSLDLGGCLRPDSLDADLDFDLLLPLDSILPLLPIEHRPRLTYGTLLATGSIAIQGRPNAPWAAGDLHLALADQPDLAGLGANLALCFAGAGPAPAKLDPGRLRWQDRRAQLTCILLDQDITLAEISVQIPWPLAGTIPDSLDLRLDAPALDIARFAPLWPDGHAVSGNLGLQGHVQGFLPQDLADRIKHGGFGQIRDLNLAVAAHARFDDLGLQQNDGTSFVLNGTVDVQGTSSAPRGSATLSLTGDLGRLDLDAHACLDSLSAAADLNLTLDSEAVRSYLPVEQQALLPRGILAVTGRVQAIGPPVAPWIHGALQLALVDQPDLASLMATIDLRLGGRGLAPTYLAPPAASWRAESLRLRLRLLDAGAELLSLSALAPLPHLAASTDSVDMRLSAPALDLKHLAPLLPAGTNLTGRLEIATRLSGLMQPGQTDHDLDLEGRLQVTDLRLQLPEGSRMAIHGRVDLAGSSLTPLIRGDLHIQGGLIRLPDPPPTLLPATGKALLWQPVSTPTVTSPVLSAEPQLQPQETAEAPPSARPETTVPRSTLPRILPDLVLTLTSPGGLWLRGQGLDVELAGDLSLMLRGDRVAVEGELQAVQGTMRQLGHLFRLERGRIAFDGSETELNPELDLVLGVRIGPYRLRILLGGTALDPNLSFTSEPELPEGDILAILLFGKPLEELDEGQTSLLATRTAQIVMAYGSARLQESLARQLGVDVVSIAPREGDEETTALTVGKYLSPRVMVRYEQLLRESSAFFVHLDYAFAGTLRLHTQVSQGEESGLQLKWQLDW